MYSIEYNYMQDSELKKRSKAFAWRLGMMIAAAVVAFVAENLGLFNLPPQLVVVLGLVLGEVSKYLNNLLSR